MSELEIVNNGNWSEFTSAPLAVLLVTESGCAHCRNWKEELSGYLQEGGDRLGFRFGVVTLDGADVESFKEANDEWLRIMDGYPFNVIYVEGEPKSSFYGGGMKRLLNRLRRMEE